MNSVHSRKLELEFAHLASGCFRLGDQLGAALKSEILRLAGGQSTQWALEATRKLELECLRAAADCMHLVGEVKNFNLQKSLLELARQLTAVAEAAPPPVCQTVI